MTIPSKTFAQFVSDLTTAWANSIGFVPALQPGDLGLALFESVAAQLVFLQAQVQIVNAVARAQTSTGADLDSFYAQFNFPRLGATFNVGSVVFSRYSPATVNVLIPGNSSVIIQTPGGAAQYSVIADTTQPGWNQTLGAYVIAPGQSSVTATVQALVAGTGPHVIAGVLSQIATPIAGVDTVNNPATINNGKDAESDTDYRARFVLYINSLSKATRSAILAAIMGVQQGLFINLAENVNISGGAQPGAFVAVIDDGSGSPPSSLLTAVSSAVEAVRGFTILPEVIGPLAISPSISITIHVITGYVPSTVNAAVSAAIVSALNQIESGQPYLYVSSIEAAALTVAGVVSVRPGATTINSIAADLALAFRQEPRITASNVVVGNY